MDEIRFSFSDVTHPTRIYWKVRQKSLFRRLDSLAPPQPIRSLDLGSGPAPQNPFRASKVFGVDFVDHSEAHVMGVDLALDPIPFPDNHFETVTAFDFIEHVPRVSLVKGKSVFPFVLLMNEISRVLSAGGVFLSVTPAYPSIEAFQDPTHVNIITESTFPRYFCEDAWARVYGFTGNFELFHQGRIKSHLYTLIRKVTT